MAAYVLVDVVSVNDPDLYDRYKQLVPPTLEKYGGTFLARRGSVRVLEGAWDPERVVVIQFDSTQRAVDWWSSVEYQEPRRMRQGATVTNMIVVEGFVTG